MPSVCDPGGLNLDRQKAWGGRLKWLLAVGYWQFIIDNSKTISAPRREIFISLNGERRTKGGVWYKMREILELLEENCRLTPAEIGVMLNMDAAEVQARIEALEHQGIILNYRAMVNWEKSGTERVQALIEVKVIPQREVGFDEIAERIYRFPEVKSVFLMSGAYDLAVMVEGKNMKEVALFVAQKLATIDNVQSTATHFILKKFKLDGVVMDQPEKVERLVVSP
jgi:DNA-binding Lrp family transcriptional regulator